MKKTFEEYVEENPRQHIDKCDSEMKEFMEFAKKSYQERNNVNWTYADEPEEIPKLVEEFIRSCGEALLLFRKFKTQKG